MSRSLNRNSGQAPSRRSFITGVSTAALIGMTMGVSGCASLPAFSLDEAVRRLLFASSERAFARLTSDGGFWDDQVAAIGLGNIMGTRGNILSTILTSAIFKDRLEDAFADLAVEGAERAAPLVADAVRVIGIGAARQLIDGGPRAATQMLRGELGMTLVDAMVPQLGERHPHCPRSGYRNCHIAIDRCGCGGRNRASVAIDRRCDLAGNGR